MQRDIAAARDRRAGRGRLEVSAERLQRSFRHRPVRPETAECADDRPDIVLPADPERRGHLARPGTGSRRQSHPGLKVVGAFTTYDLFISKDLNPALIGKAPTNTPQQMASAWADYTFQEGPLTRLRLWRRRALCRLVLCRHREHLCRFPPSCSATRRSTTNGKNWRAALNVINVADTIYVATCSSDRRLLLWRSAPRRRRACLQMVARRRSMEGGRAESQNRSHLVGGTHLEQPDIDAVPAAAVHHRPAADLPSRDRRAARLRSKA